MKLYELVGKDKNQGFSPYVWRARMALAHKGLEVEMVPLTFTEIPKVEDCESKTVPILQHEGKYITDSWDIACYLEESFPDKPSLFGGDAGRAFAIFYDSISSRTLLMPLFRTLAYDIFSIIDDRDKDYFRTSRELRLGESLENLHEHQSEHLATFQKALRPHNTALKSQNFLGGPRATYVDYILYGLFQWAKGVSPVRLLDEDDPLYGWRCRMDELFGGLGKVIRQR